jgi:hypothetical protein
VAAPVLPKTVRFRSFATDEGYEVVLSSAQSVSGSLHLFSVGEDSSRYDLGIQQVTDIATGEQLRCSGSSIEGITLEAGKTRRLKLSLATTMKLCLTMGP